MVQCIFIFYLNFYHHNDREMSVVRIYKLCNIINLAGGGNYHLTLDRGCVLAYGPPERNQRELPSGGRQSVAAVEYPLAYAVAQQRTPLCNGGWFRCRL